MQDRFKTVGWVLVTAIVLISIRTIILIALDIRAGSGAVDAVAGSADFRSISPDRIRHLDILDSLCAYPYEKQCNLDINDRGDTILFSRTDDLNRVWWSLNKVHATSIRSVDVLSLDPGSSYSTNAGPLDWSITRNTEPRSLHLQGIKVDSLIGQEMISGPIWSHRFRTRKMELIDTADVMITSIFSGNILEGVVSIERRDSTTTLLIQWR